MLQICSWIPPPGADEGDDRVPSAAPRDAHEPQGHHRAADVWAARRRDQRLDGWDLLHALAAHTQNQEGDIRCLQ